MEYTPESEARYREARVALQMARMEREREDREREIIEEFEEAYPIRKPNRR